MIRKLAVLTLVASVTGVGQVGFADEVTTYRSVEETSVVTPSAPAPATTTTDVTTPAAPAATTDTTVDTQASAPATTEEASTDQAMAGTVQSVDRRNRSLVVQDSKGKNYS